MTFDILKPYKNIDGVNINLTADEIADWQAEQDAYMPPLPPTPDLATQLAIALISKGVIAEEDVNPATLATVNDAFRVSGKLSIK